MYWSYKTLDIGYNNDQYAINRYKTNNRMTTKINRDLVNDIYSSQRNDSNGNINGNHEEQDEKYDGNASQTFSMCTCFYIVYIALTTC